MSLPAFLLIHTAEVQRLNNTTEEWDVIYEDIPCYIGSASVFPASSPYEITSASVREIIMLNFPVIVEEEEVDIALKQEDRFIINGKTYRVDKITDAENLGHHLELEIERLQ